MVSDRELCLVCEGTAVEIYHGMYLEMAIVVRISTELLGWRQRVCTTPCYAMETLLSFWIGHVERIEGREKKTISRSLSAQVSISPTEMEAQFEAFSTATVKDCLQSKLSDS